MPGDDRHGPVSVSYRRRCACYTCAVAIVLALGSAFMYGVSDYYGGRHSRANAPVAVALSAELFLSLLFASTIPAVETAPITTSAVVAGAVAGVCGSAGVIGLYVVLARGHMTVVSPVTGVVAALFPVVVGVALGERPGPVAALGIVLAVVAVALVGGLLRVSARTVDLNSILLATAVGLAFGGLFVAYSRAGDDAGLWPLLTARLGALPLLVGAFLFRRRQPSPPTLGRGVLVHGVVIAVLIALANGMYLLAVQRGLLSIVAVVVSLSPAATVALAMALDGERPTRPQLIGMVLAAAAISAVSLGG